MEEMDVATLAIALALVVLLVMVLELRGRMRALEERLAALPAAPPVAAQAGLVIPPRGPAPARVDARPMFPRVEQPPGHVGRALAAGLRWFSEGNVPVKVGMLVLFAGVAALLNYASEQGWLQVPIELRLLGVSAVALAALGFAWRQRRQRRQFALGLQGGAIGVLLLVVFAAFRLYGLLPPAAAFGLSVALVAAAGLLAVMQDAIWLALLGMVAGFLAPLWLSSGAGSHVVLFSYYAVLNAGIFGIAWWRSWRALNVLGFVSTFAIGTAWGVLEYRPVDYATTQPFLLLFFAFYLFVPILQRRRGPLHRDTLDGCLLFGTPLMAFALQAGLLDGHQDRLAWCAVWLAVLYGLLAWLLRNRLRFQALVAPYAALGLGFATLAVPLALSAHATASVFALEGAALVWLGLRQGQRRQQLAGIALQLAAAVAYGGSGAPAASVPLFLNGHVMGALLIALAGFASAWSHRASGNRTLGGWLFVWGLAWWVAAFWQETGRAPAHAADMRMVLAVATGWIASEVHRRVPAKGLAGAAVASLFAALPFAFAQDQAHGYPLAAHGWIAWALYMAAGWRMLDNLRGEEVAPAAHVGWWLSLALLASLCLHHVASPGSGNHGLGEGWRWALAGLPWLCLAAVLQWRGRWIVAPRSTVDAAWRGDLHRLVVGVLACGWLLALDEPGDAAPLAWVAAANPLDLAQFAALALVAAWLHGTGAGARWVQSRDRILAVGVFGLASVMVLRGCHHWGGVAWTSAMFDTGLVQAALTVAWSLLGVAGWISGSRHGNRTLWLAGALLMGVVLAKLLLVDRQHLGNLTGIASFLVFGGMCTLVGYLAPAPPRAEPEPAPR